MNESFARYFFGGESPLGRRVTSVNVAYEIVGVVKDAKYQGLRQEAMRTMYIPWMQREGEQPASYNFPGASGGRRSDAAGAGAGEAGARSRTRRCGFARRRRTPRSWITPS